jgi:hypothetical protein
MVGEIAEKRVSLQRAWRDFKKEAVVCREVQHPTYESVNLVIVLIYAFFMLLVQLIREWYGQLFKWFRYMVPSLPYISSRL